MYLILGVNQIQLIHKNDQLNVKKSFYLPNDCPFNPKNSIIEIFYSKFAREVL
jgi:hypothetical protein